MEDERVRDAPRSRGLPGVPSREGGKPRARCRVAWGVEGVQAQGCEVQLARDRGFPPSRTVLRLAHLHP